MSDLTYWLNIVQAVGAVAVVLLMLYAVWARGEKGDDDGK